MPRVRLYIRTGILKVCSSNMKPPGVRRVNENRISEDTLTEDFDLGSLWNSVVEATTQRKSLPGTSRPRVWRGSAGEPFEISDWTRSSSSSNYSGLLESKFDRWREIACYVPWRSSFLHGLLPQVLSIADKGDVDDFLFTLVYMTPEQIKISPDYQVLIYLLDERDRGIVLKALCLLDNVSDCHDLQSVFFCILREECHPFNLQHPFYSLGAFHRLVCLERCGLPKTSRRIVFLSCQHPHDVQCDRWPLATDWRFPRASGGEASLSYAMKIQYDVSNRSRHSHFSFCIWTPRYFPGWRLVLVVNK